MKLWVDDRRPAPPGWTPARTLDEAKNRMRTGNVTHLSLDYDLANGATTEPLVQSMIAKELPWPHTVRVNSGNPIGGPRLRNLIQTAHPRGALAGQAPTPRQTLQAGGSTRYSRALSKLTKALTPTGD